MQLSDPNATPYERPCATPHSREATDAGKHRINQLFITERTLLFGHIVPSINASPFYPETRWLFSQPAAVRTIAEEMAGIIKQLEVDVVAGCEFAGVPLAAVVSQVTGLPAIYIRKQPKAYGSRSALVGKVSGKRAVLLDDATGQGENKHQFAAYLEAAGVSVTDVLVIYWTGHPLVPWYQEHAVEHHQLIQFSDLARDARDAGYISSELYQEIWDWYEGYNIEKRALDQRRWERIFALAKRDGFSLLHMDQSHEQMVAQSKELGKWFEPPHGRYEYRS